MLAEKIDHYFTKYPQLRILFLFDAHQEHKASFEALELPHYRKVFYHNNNFELKVKLNNDWLNEKVVLYLPMAQPITLEQMHAFPLLDLLFANKAMQPDDNIGEFTEKFGLQRHQRSLAEKYLNDLKFKQVQTVMQPYLDAAHFTEDNVIHGLFAAFLMYTQIETWEVIIMRLLHYTWAAYDAEWNRISKKINDYGLEEFLLNKVRKVTGITLQSWSNANAKELLDRIKYNLYVQDLGEPDRHDPYKGYWSKSISVSASINLFNEHILSNVRHSDEWTELLNGGHSSIHEKKLVKLYGGEAPFHYYSTKLKWEILAELLWQPKIQYSTVISVTDKLTASPNPEKLGDALLFVQYSYKCLHAMNAIGSYVLDKAEQYITTYTKEYYRIDQYYRKAIWLLRFKLDATEIPVDIDWDRQTDTLNKQYRTFLEKLNREWLKCWSTKSFDIRTLGVLPQFDFYKKEIKSLDQKVAVIISDALRYEVGIELMEQLNADAKNVAKNRYMLASVPSKTSVGMANLLAGHSYVFNTDNITIDGVSAAGTNKREQLLQLAEPDSKAVKLSKLLTNSRNENREIFKSKVVYIYHNVIDATGDDPTSERKTFLNVEVAITELSKFIKQLHSTFNVAKVLITADHGFLYNDFIIEDRDKEKGSGLEHIIPHSRFEIVADSKAPEMGYIFPLKNTSKFNDDVYVVIPESVNRYARAGAGNQYVHGGASLQELIVPVIESTRKREEVSGLVKPLLINKDPKVISNVVKLTLIQENPVSAFEKERTIVVGLYKDSQLISNEKVIDLNKTGKEATERVFQVELHLVKQGKLESMYKLKIFDTNDRLNALIEADVKNQTIISNDF